MCIDFTNLNTSCPKDNFLLPRIDQLVDAIVGFAFLSFLDAYSGYNQICMDPADVKDTTFITNRGLYYYRVMPFGLKNASTTYQRLINRRFAPLLGLSIEVYVDDMLVKSRTTSQHVNRLIEVFAILCQYKMRLNPAKCVFGTINHRFHLGVALPGLLLHPSELGNSGHILLMMDHDVPDRPIVRK
ncbi:PREDICTED: RNA-directed DNA polymerase homolog [Prunus mume]|uniref:RNA-directed DNA polymerase homolog n=1 Tax=Prunus mume TaxID=102107 RepID=A0ABM1LNE8_PRUMU|nr:PREDICTED: RNA-directed DNA polymerase homolog [Prunus mume]